MIDAQVREYRIQILGPLEEKIIPTAGNEEGSYPSVDSLGLFQNMRRMFLQEGSAPAPTEGAEVADIITVQPNLQGVEAPHGTAGQGPVLGLCGDSVVFL